MEHKAEVKSILERARDIISDEEDWTKDAFCHGEDGTIDVDYIEDAVCWCAHGAILKASYETTVDTVKGIKLSRLLNHETDAGTEAFMYLKSRLPKFRNYDSKHTDIFHQYNDHPDVEHEDIIKWFDDAIEALS